MSRHASPAHVEEDGHGLVCLVVMVRQLTSERVDQLSFSASSSSTCRCNQSRGKSCRRRHCAVLVRRSDLVRCSSSSSAVWLRMASRPPASASTKSAAVVRAALQAVVPWTVTYLGVPTSATARLNAAGGPQRSRFLVCSQAICSCSPRSGIYTVCGQGSPSAQGGVSRALRCCPPGHAASSRRLLVARCDQA